MTRIDKQDLFVYFFIVTSIILGFLSTYTISYYREKQNISENYFIIEDNNSTNIEDNNSANEEYIASPPKLKLDEKMAHKIILETVVGGN